MFRNSRSCEFLRHQPEQVAGLRVVVIAVAMVVAVGIAADRQGRLPEALVLQGPIEAVGLVVRGGAEVAVEAHGAVAVVGVVGAARPVRRQGRVIGADTVAMRVGVGEDTRLQHLVRAVADAGHDVARLERRELDLLEVVLGVPVELHDTDLDQPRPSRALVWRRRDPREAALRLLGTVLADAVAAI